MALSLLVAQRLEHADLAIGLHHGLAAAIDFHGERLVLLLGNLLLAAEHELKAAGVQQPVDVDRARRGGLTAQVVQPGQLVFDLAAALLEDRFGLIGLRQFRSPLIAIPLAKPEKRLEAEFELGHGEGTRGWGLGTRVPS